MTPDRPRRNTPLTAYLDATSARHAATMAAAVVDVRSPRLEPDQSRPTLIGDRPGASDFPGIPSALHAKLCSSVI